MSLFGHTLKGQQWKVIHIEGSITANGKTLDKGSIFDKTAPIAFRSTGDFMLVLPTQGKEVLQAVHPEEFNNQNTTISLCLTEKCKALWTDPITQDIKISSSQSEDKENNTATLTITTVYQTKNFGAISHIEKETKQLAPKETVTTSPFVQENKPKEVEVAEEKKAPSGTEDKKDAFLYKNRAAVKDTTPVKRNSFPLYQPQKKKDGNG